MALHRHPFQHEASVLRDAPRLCFMDRTPRGNPALAKGMAMTWFCRQPSFVGFPGEDRGPSRRTVGVARRGPARPVGCFKYFACRRCVPEANMHFPIRCQPRFRCRKSGKPGSWSARQAISAQRLSSRRWPQNACIESKRSREQTQPCPQR